MQDFLFFALQEPFLGHFSYAGIFFQVHLLCLIFLFFTYPRGCTFLVMRHKVPSPLPSQDPGLYMGGQELLACRQYFLSANLRLYNYFSVFLLFAPNEVISS